MGKHKSDTGKHKECSGLKVKSGEVRTYTQHCVRVGMLPKASLQQPNGIRENTQAYLDICLEDDMKPTFAGYCNALGHSHTIIKDAISGVIPCPVETREMLSRMLVLLTAETEQFMVDGKINPVAGIFLMRNHMGYTNDETLTIRKVDDNVTDKATLIAKAQALLSQKD